jgi:TolB protein
MSAVAPAPIRERQGRHRLGVPSVFSALLSCAALLCCAAAWLPYTAAAAVPSVDELPICTAAGDQYAPAISGDLVVWEDGRDSTTDIYGYDLAKQTEFSVCTAASHQNSAAISGDLVVWVDYRDGNYNIYGRDLAKQTEFSICLDANKQDSPAVSGGTVVWEDYRNGNRDIYGFDLAKQTEFSICTAANTQSCPEISDGTVVWEDYRDGTWDIYGYDLATQTEFPICTDAGTQPRPAISGDLVVWVDNRNGNNDIYGYDLVKQTEFPICTAAKAQTLPTISGDTVVWADYRNGNWDIYGYDLATQAEFSVCTDANKQNSPVISGDTVVWEDGRNVTFDIYGAILSQDLTAPATTLTGADDAWHNAPVTLTLAAADDAGGSGMVGGLAKTEHKLDAGAWTVGTTLTVPALADHSADGLHTISYRSADAAGNLEAAKTATVKIDTAAPITSASRSGDTWHNSAVSLSFTAGDPAGGSGLAHSEYQLDAGAWTAGTTLTVPAPADHSGDGLHTVAYRSLDGAGNTEAAKSLTIRIDTLGPTTAGKAAVGRKGKAITLKYRIADAQSPQATDVALTVKTAKGKVLKRFSLGSTATNTWFSVKWTPKAKGSYRYSVSAKDLAGNSQSKAGVAKVTVK